MNPIKSMTVEVLLGLAVATTLSALYFYAQAGPSTFWWSDSDTAQFAVVSPGYYHRIEFPLTSVHSSQLQQQADRPDNSQLTLTSELVTVRFATIDGQTVADLEDYLVEIRSIGTDQGKTLAYRLNRMMVIAVALAIIALFCWVGFLMRLMTRRA